VAVRTGTHQPYQERHDHAAPAPAGAPAATAPAVAPAGSASATAATAAVNTVCPICAMPVDPALGTIAYKGRQVGFGCKACPAKFRAEPEKYGEAALLNKVVE
ncbi:MAG: hypothetical protein L6R48_23180, partial [Planctomycetes bacterium]|nr:hypothetical protein [Planctomycetota bacterium]